MALGKSSSRDAVAISPLTRLLYPSCEITGRRHPACRSKATLIVLCGLPGSGKTTHAKEIVQQTGAIHFCADEWMRALAIHHFDEIARHKIEAHQWAFARELLRLGHTVIIEWGPWARVKRDILRCQARDLGASVELHYFTAPHDVLLDRIHRRSLQGAEITREHIAEWNRKFRAPNSFEMALYDKAVRGGCGDPKSVGPKDPLTSLVAIAIDIALPVPRRLKAMFGRRKPNVSGRQVGGLHALLGDVGRSGLVSGQAEMCSLSERSPYGEEAVV